MAEGKQHSLAIGEMKMSSENMFSFVYTFLTLSRKVNKGIGVDNIHFLGDGLWFLDYSALNIR
jgi:PUA domain protein